MDRWGNSCDLDPNPIARIVTCFRRLPRRRRPNPYRGTKSILKFAQSSRMQSAYVMGYFIMDNPSFLVPKIIWIQNQINTNTLCCHHHHHHRQHLAVKKEVFILSDCMICKEGYMNVHPMNGFGIFSKYHVVLFGVERIKVSVTSVEAVWEIP